MMAVVPDQQTPPADSARPRPLDDPDDPDDRPVLPQRSRDETDADWGERAEPDDDERLRQERPPHYDQ
jgi:hypothetical protein